MGSHQEHIEENKDLRQRLDLAEEEVRQAEDYGAWIEQKLTAENERLREQYEDLCVDCSSSISNMEQRAERAEREVERLREENKALTDTVQVLGVEGNEDKTEVERLREENERLRAALKRLGSALDYGTIVEDFTQEEE